MKKWICLQPLFTSTMPYMMEEDYIQSRSGHRRKNRRRFGAALNSRWRATMRKSKKLSVTTILPQHSPIVLVRGALSERSLRLLFLIFRVRAALDHLYKQTHEIYDVFLTQNKATLEDRTEAIARNIGSYLVVAKLHNILLVQ